MGSCFVSNPKANKSRPLNKFLKGNAIKAGLFSLKSGSHR